MVGKVLFLLEKYCDADPAMGPTNSESQLIGAVESTGLVGEIKRFYFDALCLQLGHNKMEELLLEDCKVFRPSLIIYSILEGPLGVQLNPSNGVIDTIRNKLGIKVYLHLWDTVGSEEHVKLNRIPFADYTGIVDVANCSIYGDDRVIKAYPSIDPKYFYDKKLKRDIDICFVGAIDPIGDRWPNRIRYINFLRNNGLDVVVAGGQRQKRISWEEYSDFLCRSKISLNFSVNPYEGTSQHKARVFETLSCKTLLMEEDGAQTKQLFDVGKDFVLFYDVKDLLEKSQYYVNSNNSRGIVALNGYRKVTDIYNSRNMWGYIFEKIGFEPPQELKEDRNYKMHKEKIECLSR